MLISQLRFDVISLGATLGSLMDYNRQHPPHPQLNELAFGDFDATIQVIEQAARGELAEIGQGVQHLFETLGEPAYVMHCKDLE